MFSLLDLVLAFVGAFGFGWGLAERSNRKSLAVLSRRIDALMRLTKEQAQNDKHGGNTR